MKGKFTIGVGDVFVDERAKTMRLVLGVMDNRVVYSRGGGADGMCLITTFKKWCRRYSVVKEKEGKQ